eukprot:scaffold51125_cov38-Prasinocladus_malaysianus.AAC.1
MLGDKCIAQTSAMQRADLSCQQPGLASRHRHLLGTLGAAGTNCTHTICIHHAYGQLQCIDASKRGL